MSNETKINIKTTVKLKKIVRVIPNDQIVRIRVGDYYIDGVLNKPTFEKILNMLKEYHVWSIGVVDHAVEMRLVMRLDKFIKIIKTIAKAEMCNMYVGEILNVAVTDIDGNMDDQTIVISSASRSNSSIHSTATLPIYTFPV